MSRSSRLQTEVLASTGGRPSPVERWMRETEEMVDTFGIGYDVFALTAGALELNHANRARFFCSIGEVGTYCRVITDIYPIVLEPECHHGNRR